MATDTFEKIGTMLTPILESLGLTLWEMEFQRSGPEWLLRIYIDRLEGGVTLDDCEMVSRDLGAALDVEDIVSHAYRLEVSSPGLDRTLTKPEHFMRFLGRKIRIKTYAPIRGQKVFRGVLRGFHGDGLDFQPDNGIESMRFTLADISKASLEVEL